MLDSDDRHHKENEGFSLSIRIDIIIVPNLAKPPVEGVLCVIPSPLYKSLVRSCPYLATTKKPWLQPSPDFDSCIRTDKLSRTRPTCLNTVLTHC